MFDNISWGEIFILTGMGITFIGRKDLPGASHELGRQLGRVVGFLKGGQQRLDKFAANNELTKLQNELRMGLRELDALKNEVVVTSSAGMMGRRLGSTLGNQAFQPRNGALSSSVATPSGSTATAGLVNSSSSPVTNIYTENLNQNKVSSSTIGTAHASESLAIKAIAEDEWQKRGIGFKSRAEKGTFGSWAVHAGDQSSASSATAGGAAILASLIQENLIYDQYDRVTQEHYEILRSKDKTILQGVETKDLQ